MIRPRWLARLVTLAVTLLLLEATCRLLALRYPILRFDSSGDYEQFRAQPFSDDYDFRLNSRGYKDLEFPADKTPGMTRVVAIGDSFAFGVVPYQNNFLTLIEKRLNDSGRSVELFNMGIPGTGPEDYASMLVREALPTRPDLILLSFFVGNDFDATSQWTPTYQPLLYRLVTSPVRIFQRLEGRVIHGKGTYYDAGPAFTEAAYLDMETFRARIFQNSFERFDVQLEWTVSHLTRIKDICDRAGTPLLLALLPDEVQVDPALQQEVIAKAGWHNAQTDFERPNRALTAHLHRLNVDYIDLLPAFAATKNTPRLYRLRDTHWNAEGNAFAAQLLTEWLKARIPRL